ncbi:hypothetical protein DPMN_125515 [Dreissena polymorpha]|uniref:Uncharacterized protein n=1 Tax=Dreissena polymorpha TaxID=45954 RepID=A0A9D4JT58_DREPO|nr:hypothetical protein DPMN_125515 [Dreissena polymorpha]
MRIGGSVVECLAATLAARVRFPADASGHDIRYATATKMYPGKANKDHRPSISDCISELTDPLVNSKDSLHYTISDVSYQISDVSEYATPSDVPDDWPSIARSRPSDIKGEYDTISNFKATKKSNSRVALVHAYSHASIVPANETKTLTVTW